MELRRLLVEAFKPYRFMALTLVASVSVYVLKRSAAASGLSAYTPDGNDVARVDYAKAKYTLETLVDSTGAIVTTRLALVDYTTYLQ
jgi:hypothetical protein